MTRRRPDHSRPNVTLATVAAAVGVSRMTVSNAYNRPDQLSPELRDRVFAVAAELGYSGPNPVARTLSRGETGSIGLVLDYPLTLAFTDPAAVGLPTRRGRRHRGARARAHARPAHRRPPRGARPGRARRRLRPLLRARGRSADGRGAGPAAAVRGRRLRPRPRPRPRQRRRPRRRPLGGRSTSRSSAIGASAIVLGLDAPGSTGAEAEAAATHHVERERLAGWREGLDRRGHRLGRGPRRRAARQGHRDRPARRRRACSTAPTARPRSSRSRT